MATPASWATGNGRRCWNGAAAVTGNGFDGNMLQGRALYYISKAFTTAASKSEKIGYVDSENESVATESKATKETIDLKEVKRVDQILASLQPKLPSAPFPPAFPKGYPPAFPKGYVPPSTIDTEEGTGT